MRANARLRCGGTAPSPASGERLRFRPPCELLLLDRRRPSRARASAPPGRRCPRSRRTRCAGPAARRDSRRCRAPRPPFEQAARRLAKSAWRSAGSAANRGSTIFRQTEVLERVAGSSARKSTQAVSATQPPAPRGSRRRARQLLEAADRRRPLQRVEIVLHAQHRGRVDGRAFEDAGVELAALGHAEDLRQRPGGRVALQPRDRARRENQHAVRRFAAQRLLPGEGDHIELGPGQILGEAGAGGVADREALAVGGDEVAVRARARRRWCRSR